MTRTTMQAMVAASCVALLLISGAAQAYDEDVYLTPEQTKELDPPALKLYQKAIKAFDIVQDYEGMELLIQTAATDERHIPLQFITAQKTLRMARGGNGNSLSTKVASLSTTVDQNLRYYQESMKAIQRIIDTRNLPRDLFNRAESLRRVIAGEIADQPVREARRVAASDIFATVHSAEVQQSQAADEGKDGKGKGKGKNIVPLNAFGAANSISKTLNDNLSKKNKGGADGGGNKPATLPRNIFTEGK